MTKLKKYQMFIGGEWIDSDTKKIITTLEIPILATGKIDYVNLETLVKSEIKREGIK